MHKYLINEIRSKENHSDIIYKNDDIIAFKYSKHYTTIHIIIIPKNKIISFEDICNENIINKILLSVKNILKNLNMVNSNYRLVLNSINKDNDELYFNLIVGEKLGPTFQFETPKIRDPILYKSDLNYII